MSVDPSQFGLLGQGVDPNPLSAFDQPAAPQITPVQTPQSQALQAAPQPDPMQTLMKEMGALLKAQPSIPQTDTSGLDAQITQQRQAAAGAEQQAEAADLARADFDTQQAAQMQQFDSQMHDLMQRYPTEQVGYAAAMHAAPLAAIFATLGGKAAGLSGQAMLGALNGMMEGLNQGASDRFQQSLEKWKQELQNLKDRHERQKEIYAVMLDAYKARADAPQKARDFALQQTQDLWSQKEAQFKDRMNLFDAKEQKFRDAAQITLAMDKLAMTMGGNMTPEVRALDAAITQAGVTIPGAGRGGQLYYQKLNDLIQQNPSASPQQIAQQVKEGRLDMKAAETETTVAARKEASIGAAQEAMNSPGGLWDQVNAAAKKVDFGSAKFKNNFDLAVQGKYVDDKNIQGYVSTVMEARAELSQIFSRSGQTTDMARKMAEEAIPLAASYESLQEAEARSKQGAQAVRAGNQRYMDEVTGRQPQTFSTEADAEAAFKAGKIKKGERITVGGVSGTWQ